MKKASVIFILTLLTVATLKADIPKFDVITIEYQDSIYFLGFENKGQLLNNDLFYYNYKNEIKSDVATEVENYLSRLASRSRNIVLYRKCERINLRKFERHSNGDSILYILKDEFKVKAEELTCKYEIRSAENGCTSGYAYTEELNSNDNFWIADYEIETLFNFSDNELCDMTLYGIKGNIRREEAAELKAQIKELFKNFKRSEFKSLLSELYKRNIIMIGFCSC